MKKVLASIALPLLLVACTPSVESLKSDEELLKATLKECADMGTAAKDDQACKNAAQAAKEKAVDGVKGLFDN